MVSLARLIGIAGGFFFGIVLHEYAHAKASDLLGDRYPRLQGRVTLKPKAHADPIGTLAMPALFLIVSLVGQPFRMIFGYGKPMQYNPAGLRNPKRDQIVVALAGPAVNLALAAVAGFAARSAPVIGPVDLPLALAFFTTVNVFLLVVNVLPIPPLDGSKILGLFLSPGAQHKMQEYAQYILLFLVILFFLFQGVLAAMTSPVCRVLLGFPAPTPCLL